VRAVGGGPSTLVLAHGFGTNQSVWAHYLPWLSERYRVITYDLASADTADPVYFDIRRHGDLGGHADDLLEIIRGFAVDRCTYVGHSVSGMIGILAAIEAPQLFERLILIAPSARYLDAPGYRGGFDREAIEGMLSAISTRFRDWANFFAPLAMGLPIDDPVAESFLSSLLRMRPGEAVAMAHAIFLSDYRDVLGACRVPVTILQTKSDPAVPIEAARYLADHLPQAELEVIEATGHLPHLSAPAVIDRALHAHLPRFAPSSP
jgi:sigma-B regulation protein RsbQ